MRGEEGVAVDVGDELILGVGFVSPGHAVYSDEFRIIQFERGEDMSV